MCGRYVTVSSPALLAERFHVTDIRPQELEPSYNVAPRADVPIVAERSNGSGSARERVLDVVRWGLVPFWAKDPKVGDRMINARADKILTSNAFKRPFERKRCIVPADGFYEWEKLDPEKSRSKKQPWLTAGAMVSRRVRGAVGVVAAIRTPPTSARLRTCVIITTDPNELVAPIDDRMPVVLPESAWDTWLDVENHDTAALKELLVPLPADELEAWTVSALVNKADNNGPS